MIQLPCRLGLCGPAQLLPRWLLESPERIAHQIALASNDQIQLQIDVSGIANPLSTAAAPVGGLDLHDASDALTRNYEVERLQAISIIFAHSLSYEHPVFGMMFDHGISSLPGGDLLATRIAREGCAIFLGNIATSRCEWKDAAPVLDEAYELETYFTTIHELGHVFNLGHVGSINAPSFMTQSPPNAPFDPDPAGAWRFTPDHSARLTDCHDPDVMPGGSPFSDIDPFSLPKRKERGSGESLALEVAMHRNSFLPFEPVELDLRLRLRTGHRTATAPDRIDPGYGEFTIWIEEPSGERRRYRSPRHYCLQPARLRLSQAAPFARDVSIFLESGGYTFRREGIHCIRAEFAISRSRKLRSNAIEVEVRSPSRKGGGGSALRRVLGTPGARKLLYHRRLSSLDEAAPLEELCARLPDSPSSAGVRYALGRAYSRAGEALAARAREHLEWAADDPQLSLHQQMHCRRELEHLEDRPRAVASTPRWRQRSQGRYRTVEANAATLTRFRGSDPRRL